MREIGHVPSLLFALGNGGCFLGLLERDYEWVRTFADELAGLAQSQKVGFWAAIAVFWRCLVDAIQGFSDLTSQELMERAEPSSSVRADIVFGLVLIAQLNLVRGNLEEGAKFIEEATRELDRTDMRHYEAELHRTRGEISLLEGKCGDAQARFEQAIEAAWTQGARSWELRAALSLARLWQSQGIAGEARALLTPIYAWFTEGFDTADLLDARALLKSLVE